MRTYFGSWHKTDMLNALTNVCYRGKAASRERAVMSANDPKRIIGLRSQLDCETRKLDTCLWNSHGIGRRALCAFAPDSDLQTSLSSVPTDKEAFDEHQDRVAGT